MPTGVPVALGARNGGQQPVAVAGWAVDVVRAVPDADRNRDGPRSEEHTLNSSHGYSSYAVFCLKKKKSLRIYAYKTGKLTPDTQLYSAPFFNVRHDDGDVCMGNAKMEMPEKINFHNFIKFWEDKFFLSEFSQIIGSNPVKNNLATVIKKSSVSFDNKELLPIRKLKLKNLLK